MSRRRRTVTEARPWVPLRPMPAEAMDAVRARAARDLVAEHVPLDEVDRVMRDLEARQEMWVSDRYAVIVDRDVSRVVTHLSIRRLDRRPIRDWRHFQRIKNEIAGADVEAVELYPRVDRLVDSANQYHLWCFPPGEVLPLGFSERLVDDTRVAELGGKQRPGAEQ